MPLITDKQIADAFYSSDGFVSANKLYNRLKEQYKGNRTVSVRKDIILKWFNKQYINQVTKRRTPVRQRLQVRAPRPLHTINIDLIEMPTDKGFKYILSVIDVYSRYGEAEPLKGKTAVVVLEGFKRILARLPVKDPLEAIAEVHSDDGGEFKSVFKAFIESHNIRMFPRIVGEKQQNALVESFNGIIEQPLIKKMSADLEDGVTNKKQWVAFLPSVIKGYNNDIHSSIDAKPLNAVKGLVQPALPPSDSEKAGKTLQTINRNLPVGTKVRIAHSQGIRSDPTRTGDFVWSDEIYTISKRTELLGEKLVFYRAKDSDGNINKGLLYPEELQKITNVNRRPIGNAGPQIDVEKVIRKEKRKEDKARLNPLVNKGVQTRTRAIKARERLDL